MRDTTLSRARWRIAAGFVLPPLVGGLLWALPEPVSVTESAFMAVVVVSAVLGGRACATVAVVVSSVFLWALLHPLGPSLRPIVGDHLVAVALFGFAGLAVTHIVTALEEARRQAAERADLERRTVELLQQAMLPDLSDLPGVEVAARYRPASGTAEIGGDFYAAFVTSKGTNVLVIGDVVGHGVGSAAAMAEVRSVVRAYAEICSAPGEILTLTNQLLARHDDAFVTSIVATIEPGGTLVWASAGHPPPLVRRGGSSTFLDRHGGPPLGAFTTTTYEDNVEPLQPGDGLLLYTDGLVERPGESIDVGLRRLADAVAVAAHDGVATRSTGSAPDLCDAAFGALVGHQRDDVCVLAMVHDVQR